MKETLNFNCEKFKGRVNQKLHKMFFCKFFNSCQALFQKRFEPRV
jgi:hypothetical protein